MLSATKNKATQAKRTQEIKIGESIITVKPYILPHYNKFITRFENFEEICSNYEQKKNIKVIRLNDGEAILIENNNVEIIK